MGPHCLPYRLLKHFSRREKQTTFVANDALRVKSTVKTAQDDLSLCLVPSQIVDFAMHRINYENIVISLQKTWKLGLWVTSNFCFKANGDIQNSCIVIWCCSISIMPDSHKFVHYHWIRVYINQARPEIARVGIWNSLFQKQKENHLHQQ